MIKKFFSFLFHFLGSVYFAIALILCVILFVATGTLLESWTGSHLFAVRFTYHNPVFSGLLFFFFVNILFSALRRFPYQWKHIPFLCSHLGLLMIILGVFLKGVYGIQGIMSLAEGSGNDRLWLPQNYSLYVEERTSSFAIPLSFGQLGPIPSPFPDLKISLLEWIPHSSEQLEGWIKKDKNTFSTFLVGFPPIQVPVLNESEELPLLLKSGSWHFYLGKKKSYSVKQPPQFPAIVIVQDSTRNEYVILWNEKGEILEKKFLANQPESLLVFDKGFEGYALFSEVPSSFPFSELMVPLTHSIEKIPPTRKKEDNIPAVRCFLEKNGKHEVVTLGLDRYATRFKWPALQGNYLLRLQSEPLLLPHHVRLKEAREITYAHSSQPYSFECDVTIDGNETTLSMNHVYETEKGYRFYLSNLVSPTPFSAKKVLLAVNYDPAKYWLTYPGGVILALGMVLFLKQIRKKL